MPEGPPNIEVEAAAQEETAQEAPETAPEEETPQPRRRGLFGRWFGRGEKPVKPAQEEARQEMEAEMRAGEKEAGQPWTPERVRELARSRNPEDLVHLMSIISAEQFRELKLEEKHGAGRLAEFKKFLSGERDFELTEDGQIKHRAWKELGRKALTTIFNRKTGLAAGTLFVTGLLTSGAATPAMWALYGSVIGRGTGEGLEYAYGHERGRREKIVEAQYDQWAHLHELALKTQQEGVSNEEKAKSYTDIINGFYNSSEQVIKAEKRLGETKKIWDRRRDILTAIGGAAGAAAGLWTGLKGITDIGRFNLDGDKIWHSARRINNVWHFAYRAGDAMGGQAVPLGERIFHVVGPHAGEIIGKTAGQIAAVFGGLGMGQVLDQWREGRKDKMAEILKEERQAQREEMEGKVPAMFPPTPAAEVSAEAEPAGPTIPEKYQSLSQELEKGFPEPGQIWIYQDVGGYGFLKILRIHWQVEPAAVDVEILDRNFQKTAEQSYSLEQLLRKGAERKDFVNDWLLTVKEGADVRIDPEQRILDRYDPKGERLLPAEPDGTNYKFRRIEGKPSQAELSKEGQPKTKVDIFDLAFWGIRPVEPERRERPAQARAPKINEIWVLRPGVQLPAGLPNRVIVNEVEEGILYLLNAETNQIVDEPIEDIAQFVSLYRKVGAKRGGGGGQQRQRGGQQQNQ